MGAAVRGMSVPTITRLTNLRRRLLAANHSAKPLRFFTRSKRAILQRAQKGFEKALKKFTLFNDHKGSLLWWQPGAAMLQRAKKKKVTNFNDHDRSLLRRLPGATILQRENQQLHLPHQLHIRLCRCANFRSWPVNSTHVSQRLSQFLMPCAWQTTKP